MLYTIYEIRVDSNAIDIFVDCLIQTKIRFYTMWNLCTQCIVIDKLSYQML